jgi:hypothetical protein
MPTQNRSPGISSQKQAMEPGSMRKLDWRPSWPNVVKAQ